MNLRKALLHTLTTVPNYFLFDPVALHVEANNRASQAFSTAEMLAELDRMEVERLVLGERVQGVLKWKITGAGRAWLRE